MLEESKKNSYFYYISNHEINEILIIDSKTKKKIRSINLPFIPFKMIQDDINIYVSGNGENMAIINKFNDDIKIMSIENNGNIALDKNSNKIYISNISKVYVYDIKSEKIIKVINGFGIVDNIIIDNDNGRLFIVDILKRKLSIYDIKNMRKISVVENIGIKSSDIKIYDEKIYIANRGGIDGWSGNISIIDIKNNKLKTIDLQKNSSIKSLVVKDNIIYALNYGLNRIDLIDINTGILERNIKVLNPKYMILDNNKIIILGKPSSSRVSITIHDIDNKSNNTLFINEEYGIPYDAIVVSNYNERFNTSNDIEEAALEMLENKVDDIEIREYSETMSLQNIIAEVPTNYKCPIVLENIVFGIGYIVKGSEEIERKNNNIIIKFKLKIPYRVMVKDKLGEAKIIRKSIETKKVIIIESFYLKSCDNTMLRIITKNLKLTKLQILKDIIIFSLSIHMKLKIIADGSYRNSINIKNNHPDI
ncbi:YncE family protein [Clostridium ihumii]|uniref:YncE family protein n=1 Tax=Clostridium ihumii TaxID=1470356 RepID=UPI003D348163